MGSDSVSPCKPRRHCCCVIDKARLHCALKLTQRSPYSRAVKHPLLGCAVIMNACFERLMTVAKISTCGGAPLHDETAVVSTSLSLSKWAQRRLGLRRACALTAPGVPTVLRVTLGVREQQPRTNTPVAPPPLQLRLPLPPPGQWGGCACGHDTHTHTHQRTRARTHARAHTHTPTHTSSSTAQRVCVAAFSSVVRNPLQEAKQPTASRPTASRLKSVRNQPTN